MTDNVFNGPVLAYDCESTGVDVLNDRIITATVVRLEPGVESVVRSTVIDPGVEVPAEASAVNGFTTERVRAEGKPPPPELEWIAAALTDMMRNGRPVIIANAPFDLSMLDAELRRHGLPDLTERMGGPLAPVIDPMVLDKRVVKFRRRVSPTQGARQLITLCQVHGLGWDEEQAHTSAYDAVMAGRVTWQLMRKFPALSRLSLAELHTAQVGWYAEQAEGLRGWFASEAAKREQWSAQAHRAGDGAAVGKHDADMVEFLEKARSVDTAWPIRPWMPPPEPPITAADLAWVEDPAAVTP
jgi:DNA polymerase III subunit epsilon